MYACFVLVPDAAYRQVGTPAPNLVVYSSKEELLWW